MCCPCLGGGILLESSSHDAVELLVLAPVCHHLVGVRAVVVALQAVEVARALLVRACAHRQETKISTKLQQAAQTESMATYVNVFHGMVIYYIYITRSVELFPYLMCQSCKPYTLMCARGN